MENEESIFAEAISQPTPEAREAFIDAACVGNATLRARIAGLVWAHEHPDSFLDPKLNLPKGDPRQPSCDETITTSTASDPTGTAIGLYKLLQKIGEGGMGRVYLAEQTHPMKRKVAVKLIKSGLDSRQVIARFEAERQALAMMDHPHIARVLDAGTTETGVPYFVMELVNGIPMTKYCDEHRLTLRDRLELFIPVCQAVQHAHQKGIIHRDLKPSNVLVAKYDGRPVPKVIDFGVAKATGSELTERTMFTEFGAILGTLEYMSPEQAERNQLDIDTRSDIYSLGVLIYELLTGTTPLDKKRFKDVALLELLRVIKEEESPKPSTRLISITELPSIAANRCLEPAKLSGLIRGDLDWIVMKALEKDRNRRYETANGFALDIQRYLLDEPVQACPPSAGYRVRKFARRHRWGIGTAAAIFAALFVAAIASILAIVHSTRAADLERETRRAMLMQALHYHLSFSEHDAGWSEISWGFAQDIANLRLGNDVRAAAASTLLGTDAKLAKTIDFEPADLAYDPSGKRLLMTRFVPENPQDPQNPRLREGVTIWDSKTDQQTELPQPVHDAYGPIRYQHDGTPVQLVWNKNDATVVVVWDLAAANAVHRLECPFPLETNTVIAWSLTAGGMYAGIVVADPQGQRQVLVWQSESGNLLAKLPTKCTNLEISPDGGLVAISDSEGRLEIWSVTKGEWITTLPAGHASISCMAWTQDYLHRAREKDASWLLAVGSSGGDLTIWDVTARIPRSFCRGSAYDVNRVAFSPDGMTLASVGRSNPMIWEVTTGRLALRLAYNNLMTAVAYSPDGSTLAVGSNAIFGNTGGVEVWNLSAARGQQILHGLHAPISQVCLSPDNRLLAALAQNWQLAIWDVPANRLLHIFETPKGLFAESAALTFDTLGRRIGFASGQGAKMWDMETGAELLSLELPSGYLDRMAFQGTDRLLLIRQESVDPRFPPIGPNPNFQNTPRVCRLRDLLSPDPLKSLKDVKDFPASAVVILMTPDGNEVVIEGIRIDGGQRQREIKLFELPAGKERWALRSEFGKDTHRTFSLDPTGVLLLMYDAGFTKYVVTDLANGRQVHELAHGAARLGPRAQTYISSAKSRLPGKSTYSLALSCNEMSVLTLFENPGGPDAMCFSADGNHIVWGNVDGTVTACDIRQVDSRLRELGMEWNETSTERSNHLR
jgi:serine/threonine protein kinase/WD40 repeat protein